jgi:nicotinamidase-related amidase
MELDKTRTAVIAAHFENDIVTADGAFGGFFAAQATARGVVDKARSIIDAAHAAGATVVYTKVGWDAGHHTLVPNNPLLSIVAQQGCLVNGTWQTELVEGLTPVDGDYVLTNERVSNFADSPLDTILKGHNINTVVIFGVATNLSVEDSARHASNLGYRVVVVDDASSAASDDAHAATLGSIGLLGEVAQSADVIAALSA